MPARRARQRGLEGLEKRRVLDVRRPRRQEEHEVRGRRARARDGGGGRQALGLGVEHRDLAQLGETAAQHREVDRRQRDVGLDDGADEAVAGVSAGRGRVEEQEAHITHTYYGRP